MSISIFNILILFLIATIDFFHESTLGIGYSSGAAWQDLGLVWLEG